MRIWFGGPRILGVRTGISLGPEDFRRFNRTGSATQVNPIDPDHSFIYVVKGDHNRCKIGLTSNPNARLAQLRTASAFPIDFAWIGAPRAQAVGIEHDAHVMLDAYRRNGEWFDVSPDAAVGAISAAAQRRGQPIVGLTPDLAEQARLISLSSEQPKDWWIYRHPWKFMIFTVLALWIIFFLLIHSMTT